MSEGKGKNIRRREVWAGLVFLLALGSYMAALLADFQFISPYTTLEEDLQYLINNQAGSRVSTWIWLGTFGATLLTAPFLLMIFHKRLVWLHYLIALLLVAGAGFFLLMGLEGLGLQNEISLLAGQDLQSTDTESKYKLLALFRKEQFWRYAGSSCIGGFALLTGLSRFRVKRFPAVSSILMVISGPTLIYFNWTNPDHLIRTAAMAGIMIGVSVLSVRLINKGF